MGRRRVIAALALGGTIAGATLLAGADAPKKKDNTIEFTEKDLDGGVIKGHVQRPEAVYVVPRNEGAKKAVESTGDHLDEALQKPKK